MIGKRLLASVLAFSMIFGTASVPAGNVDAADGKAAAVTDGLLAYYDFAEKPLDGKTVANQAAGGIGAAVVENEGKAEWQDNALVLSGEGTSNAPVGSWVSLPADLFAGKESATITMEVCPTADIITKNHFMWSIGNDKTDTYWFANAYAPRTSIKYDGNEKTAQSAKKLKADRWYSCTGVIDAQKKTISLYIDGRKVGETSDSGMSLSKVTGQSRNTIGRAPYPDALFSGKVASFRAYGRALTEEEIGRLAEEDGKLHQDSVKETLQEFMDSINEINITDSRMILPDYDGRVTWTSDMPEISIGEDGVTAACIQPANGSTAVTGVLKARASMRGVSLEKEIKTTIQPVAADTDTYGYLMVHFVEDSNGYKEKIYLDISRGDNPEQWDPLNGGEPIVTSNLGTTGVRDPFLTYNPETKTYYIIATDLRVFGADNAGWTKWQTNYSTKMNVWESKDLVKWENFHQFDVAYDKQGKKLANLGMMWAPEATWVPDYYEEGKGAFVVYWASNVFNDEAQTQNQGTKILWAATTDFSQETYEYGGIFVDGARTIDTTMTQYNGKTYRITKEQASNQANYGVYMESTSAKEWWKPETEWTVLQRKIGTEWVANGSPGGVEGPAAFKNHSEDKWYLYVDVIPAGYQPMVSTNLEQGFQKLDSGDFYMKEATKHGGIISLTKAEYDRIRKSDAVSVVQEDLGNIAAEKGSKKEELESRMPDAQVTLAYGYGSASLPVDWDLSGVDLSKDASYRVRGTVQSIGANDNEWYGTWQGNTKSKDYRASNKTLYSMTAKQVQAVVVVGKGGPIQDDEPGIDIPPSEEEPSFVDVPPAVEDGLLAYYDFAKKPSDGKTVANQAAGGVGAAVVENEGKAEWQDNALVLSGEGTSNAPVGSWVSLPADLFAGKESATITMEVCPSADIITKNHFMWSIGNDKTDAYWFANTLVPRTSIKYGGSEKTAQSSEKLAAGRWYSYTGVIDAQKKTISLYIDGKKVAESTDNNMSLAQVADQSRNTIGRAPYPDPLFSGKVSSFRAYGRALTEKEIKQISDAEGKRHEASVQNILKEAAGGIRDVELTDSRGALPDYGGMVTWSSDMPEIKVGGDGNSFTCKQPAKGSAAVTGKLTAVISMRGCSLEKEVKATIQPAVADTDTYGYLMVHFRGGTDYNEKVYLTISSGNSPTQWDALNGGKEVLVSELGTTGVRDPAFAYNPETKTYYIIATDLRVFGGDNKSWGYWCSNGSTKVNVWESKDLVNWGNVRQFDVALDQQGQKAAELGMMWAPEATWVDDYYGDGKGAFVLYWSSTVFGSDDPGHTKGSPTRVVWGATTDFTQETYEYGGVWIEREYAAIDTSIIQHNGYTYRSTKNDDEDTLFFERTDAGKWWLPEAKWELVEEGLGKNAVLNYARGIEGPTIFKSNTEERWYLYADDPDTYVPVTTDNLDKGWSRLEDPDQYLPAGTHHGDVISLTKAQYDAIRNADASSAVKEDLGEIHVKRGLDAAGLQKALPQTAAANLYCGYGTADFKVQWDTAAVDTAKDGTYQVTGKLLGTIGANHNAWVGKGGSTAYNSEDHESYSVSEISVKATVRVTEEGPKPPVIIPDPGTDKVPVSSVKLSKSKLTLGGGERYKLTASVSPKKATDKKVTWKSSNKKAAVVSTKGIVTAKKIKKKITVKITAKAGGKTSKPCTITVKPAPKKITLNASKKTLKKGKSFKIKVNLPKNTASNKITFTSSKRSVAKVSSSGKVTAGKKGKATITVKTFNNKKARIIITVK